MKTYTEQTGELNYVLFSDTEYQCVTRPVPQANISQDITRVLCNQADSLRPNTENTALLPNASRASVSCVVNIQATAIYHSVLSGPAV